MVTGKKYTIDKGDCGTGFLEVNEAAFDFEKDNDGNITTL